MKLWKRVPRVKGTHLAVAFLARRVACLIVGHRWVDESTDFVIAPDEQWCSRCDAHEVRVRFAEAFQVFEEKQP